MTCLDATAFVDGELEPDRAAAFREHLVDCSGCSASVLRGHQLSAQLSTLGDHSDLVWLLDDVRTRLARLGTCSCHNELRNRLAGCTALLERMVGP